jgi:hypothetical protein
VGHGENEVRLHALRRVPPQQPIPSAVKPEGGPAASLKLGQKSCVISGRIITLSARGPSDGLGRSPHEATMINHVRVTNVARQC